MANYKFKKLGSSYTWENGESMSHAAEKVHKADASATQMLLDIGSQHYILNTGRDSVFIEGVLATGTMEQIRDRLLVEIFDTNYVVS